MNFAFEEVKGGYDNANIRSFQTSDSAKKYCMSNEFCVAVKGNDAIISMDEMTESNDTILKKKSTNFLSKENIGILKSDPLRPLALTLVEKDSKVVLIIYKCPGEKERLALDFAKSELYGLMFMESSGFELKKLGLPEGKYLVRQIFFVNTEKSTQEYSIVFSNSQLVTYLDGIMVKRSWTPGNYGYVHSISLNFSKGIHSIVNDFSFDTNVMTMDLDPDVIDTFFMPSLNKSVIDTYEDNLLFYSTVRKMRTKNFEDYCTADKLTEEKCLKHLKSIDLTEDSRQKIKAYELDSKILQFVEYVYTRDDVDYDVSKDIKQLAESYLISKFSNLDFTEMDTILFLLKFVDNVVKTKLIPQEVLDLCADEKSSIFKSGVCRNLETSLPGDQNIKDNIERRNYIYCISEDSEGFVFDKESTRCSIISDEAKNHLRASKCENYTDNTYCRNLSLSNEEVQLRRNIFLDELLSSKEGIDTLAKDYSTVFGKSLELLDQKTNDIYAKQTDYSNAATIASISVGSDLEEITKLAENIAKEGLDNAESEYNEVLKIHKMNELLFPEEVAKEAERKEKLKYIERIYSVDGRALTDFITDLYEKGDCRGCEELYNALQNSDNEDTRNIIKYSRKIKNKSEANMFSTEPDDIIINSKDVLRYCTNDPFNSKCSDYYTEIYKLKLRSAEELSNREKKNADWYDFAFVIIMILLFIIVCFSLFARKENNYKTTYDYENQNK